MPALRATCWWHSLSRLCENPRTGYKACAAKNLMNQPLPDLWVMLSIKGERGAAGRLKPAERKTHGNLRFTL